MNIIILVGVSLLATPSATGPVLMPPSAFGPATSARTLTTVCTTGLIVTKSLLGTLLPFVLDCERQMVTSWATKYQVAYGAGRVSVSATAVSATVYYIEGDIEEREEPAADEDTQAHNTPTGEGPGFRRRRMAEYDFEYNYEQPTMTDWDFDDEDPGEPFTAIENMHSERGYDGYIDNSYGFWIVVYFGLWITIITTSILIAHLCRCTGVHLQKKTTKLAKAMWCCLAQALSYNSSLWRRIYNKITHQEFEHHEVYAFDVEGLHLPASTTQELETQFATIPDRQTGYMLAFNYEVDGGGTAVDEEQRMQQITVEGEVHKLGMTDRARQEAETIM